MGKIDSPSTTPNVQPYSRKSKEDSDLPRAFVWGQPCCQNCTSSIVGVWFISPVFMSHCLLSRRAAVASSPNTASASCDYDQRAAASEGGVLPYSDRSVSIVSKRILKIPVLLRSNARWFWNGKRVSGFRPIRPLASGICVPQEHIPEGARRAWIRCGRRSPRLSQVMPEHVEALTDWHQLSLLSVESSRCPKWYMSGLLLIGDAAHVMSPIGGVGINYAIQDAVAAANLLGEHLKTGSISVEDLAKVQ